MSDPISVFLGPWASGINTGSVIARTALSLLFSFITGCERSGKRHSAGLRTFTVISLSSTLAMLTDMYLIEYRGIKVFAVTSAAVLGTAMLCVRSLSTSSRNKIKGLNTAVGLLSCSICSLACGAGLYTLSVVGFASLLCCLRLLPTVERYLKNHSNHFEINLELRDSSFLQNFVTTIRRLGLTIDEIEKNTAYTGSGLSVYSLYISISSPELKKFKTHREIIEALRSLKYISYIEEMNF